MSEELKDQVIGEKVVILEATTPVDEASDKDEWGISRSAERKLLWKLDMRIIIPFGALYMMSALGELGVIAPLTYRSFEHWQCRFSTDLKLVGNQYGAAVSVVYSTYIAFEPVWSTIFKIVGPRRLCRSCIMSIELSVVTANTIAWSAVTIGTGFVTNWNELLACRILLGVAEAGVIPCIGVYLTMYYNRDEYGPRQIITHIASAMSGAFGGLLAFGLSQIDAAGLHGWQWMYLVEGLLSMSLAPLIWIVVPSKPSEAWWLNEDERHILRLRAERNKMVFDEDEQFDWRMVKAALKDVRLYLHGLNQFATNTTLYSITNFLPSIVAGLGFTTRVQAQLLTVPVYTLAAIGFCIVVLASDKRKSRAPFIVLGHTGNLIGFIILATCASPGARYAGTFICGFGLYVVGTLNIIWANNNNAGHFKRAFSAGFIQLIGNISGAIIGFIYRAQDAPRYIPGLKFNIAMMCMGILVTGILYWINSRKIADKKRRIAAGEPNQPHLGDSNPHYTFYL